MVRIAHEVSIVIPFYGRLPLARAAIDAALAQRGIACELIVVDVGSREDTTALGRYVERRGGTFVRQSHGGIAAARNAGLAAASGRWVTFVDSDDVIYPAKLAVQVAACGASPGAVWSSTGFDLLSPSGACVGGDSLSGVSGAFWRTSCPFGSTSVVARRDVLNAIRGFDPAFKRSEDWDLFLRLGEISPPAILHERLYGYRVDCGNVSGEDPEQWVAAWTLLCSKHAMEVTPDSYAGIRYNRSRLPAEFPMLAVRPRHSADAAVFDLNASS
jgi:glycosyltransferase involved in cell wall biosynthesis